MPWGTISSGSAMPFRSRCHAPVRPLLAVAFVLLAAPVAAIVGFSTH
jgi:hypothetical protein